MIFKWIDRKIDKRVAEWANIYRKAGRRAERFYYTAYKDWLAYTARRSYDVSVKVTMCTTAICGWMIMSGTKRLFHYTFEDDSPTAAEMRSLLDKYNLEGPNKKNS